MRNPPLPEWHWHLWQLLFDARLGSVMVWRCARSPDPRGEQTHLVFHETPAACGHNQ